MPAEPWLWEDGANRFLGKEAEGDWSEEESEELEEEVDTEVEPKEVTEGVGEVAEK